MRCLQRRFTPLSAATAKMTWLLLLVGVLFVDVLTIRDLLFWDIY